MWEYCSNIYWDFLHSPHRNIFFIIFLFFSCGKKELIFSDLKPRFYYYLRPLSYLLWYRRGQDQTKDGPSWFLL